MKNWDGIKSWGLLEWILAVTAVTWCAATIVEVATGRAHPDGCGCFVYDEPVKK